MRVFVALARRLGYRARIENLEREVWTLRRALRRSVGETRAARAQINAANKRPDRGHWVPICEQIQLAHDLQLAQDRIVELEEAGHGRR